MLDLTMLTPAPWGFEHGTSDHFHIHDSAGACVASTADRMDPEAYASAKDYEQDFTNAEFIALARNAFDVKMRRKWWAVPIYDQYTGQTRGWLAMRLNSGAPPIGAVSVLPSIAGCAGHADWRREWPDPFTCLVEADEWYKANVEAKE